MNPPSSNGNSFSPDFTVKMEGHAFAHFTGPRDPDSVKALYEYLKREKWRGRLMISFTGNGGVTDIIFDEVKRITKAGENGNIETG